MTNDSQIILNMTEGFYFIYRGGEEEYKKILKTLISPDRLGFSRWLRDDKIIFVPDHLLDYVMRTYENIYP
jgi:hypothetical protein